MIWLFLACATPKTTSPQPQTVPALSPSIEVCDFATKQSTCLGQQVSIFGMVPQTVYSHPIVSSSGANAVQSYIDVDGRQLIVLSAEPVSCSNQIQVSGILREVDLGGPAGTRGSYRNFYIEQSTVICLSESE